MSEKKGIENYKSLQDYVYAGLQNTVGQNLLKLRHERSLTREELSNMSDVSEETIFCLEKGVHLKTASVEVCRKLANAYGMSLEDFTNEVLKGHEDIIVPGNSVLTMDFAKVYPFNLVKIVFGKDIPLLDVSVSGVLDAVSRLTEKEQEVIRCRYEDRMTPSQTVKRLGKTKDYVFHIESDALRKLRLAPMKRMMKAVSPSEVERQADVIKHLEKRNSELNEMLLLVKNLLKEDFSEEKFEEIAEPDAPAVPIEQLDLSMRAYNCLKRNGIKTTDDLIGLTQNEICELRNFGASSLREVNERLAERGMHLKKEA